MDRHSIRVTAMIVTGLLDLTVLLEVLQLVQIELECSTEMLLDVFYWV
jgi:hypothetical protein